MSHIPRLYLTGDLKAGASVSVDDGQGKYLTRVMRLSEGDTVRAFNGRDGEWTCELKVSGKKVSVEPHAQTRAQVFVPNLTLLFAPLKKTRTDFVIEKAVELGVKTIQPILTKFTQTQRVRVERFQALAVEAAEQTERLDVPDICEAEPLWTALAEWDERKPLFYCDEGSEARPMIDSLAQNTVRDAGLLIGPEGGFSNPERDRLRALAFAIPVTLGPRILRAETAVVSALTLWQSQVGDWRDAPYVPET
ncbi:MAG: 16S rRNA (uracil(1498)-N(3))-methyltransferase [Pseudomonadota bacterium]